MGLLFFYVFIAIGASFACSIMEAVLLSITPSYVSALEAEQHPRAPTLRAFKNNVDRPLAAILSLNTIAHTIGAAGAGAQAQAVFGDAWITVSSIVLTLLILVLSEIIPKTLGAVYWRALAMPVTRLLGPLMTVMTPFVKLSEAITARVASSHAGTMSREEFAAMADIGQEEGLIDASESTRIKSLFGFSQLQVKDAMTPRPVMRTFPQAWTVSDVLAHHPDLHFSRIPLRGDDPSHVTDYVLKTDVYLAAATGRADTPLDELERPLTVVHETDALPDVLEQLLDQNEHIALVVDEYGSVAGVITLEDLLETLLGLEIVDEVDGVRDMQALAREQWRKRAARLGIVASPDPGDEDPTHQ